MKMYDAKILKDFIDKNNLTISNTALKLDISRQSVYTYLEKGEIPRKVYLSIKYLEVFEKEL